MTSVFQKVVKFHQVIYQFFMSKYVPAFLNLRFLQKILKIQQNPFGSTLFAA